ncbi:hypothetical protein HK105_209463 [Polyrhizophydium stewartii]|uniref:Uncharacterized protein n=1 Tax=Polyrhizophydium stewartii TaxID=2732419 RepID=A0ABR4MUZ3_9FUNG
MISDKHWDPLVLRELPEMVEKVEFIEMLVEKTRIVATEAVEQGRENAKRVAPLEDHLHAQAVDSKAAQAAALD